MRIRLLLIIAFVVIGLAALSHLNPTARQSLQPIQTSLQSLRSWFKETVSSAPTPQAKPAGASTNVSSTKVYKWQEQNGQWQFSSEPPPAGVASSVTTYRSDTNIMQAPPVPATENSPAPSAASEASVNAKPLLPLTDPDRVKQLMDDARTVQNLMDQRLQTLDESASSR